MEERSLEKDNLPPLTVPDLSPEARRKLALRKRAGLQEQVEDYVGPRGTFWATRLYRIVTRIWTGAYNDGFIHAGNLAYMSILALFPFFITVAAIFSLLGEAEQREASIRTFLLAVPPVVASAIEPVARDVILARSGWLLWVGGLVGLWTVGSLIETMRDILRRAYGTRSATAFWRYRLISSAVIVLAVVALLFSLFAQVAIGAAEQVIAAWFPRFANWTDTLATTRLVPAAILFVSLYLLFYTLTPTAYRARRYPKWPGALLVTGWWVAVMVALPDILARFFTYDLTYGSLAGVMIALFFFWLVGLGMVVGAELNAALAVTPEESDMAGRHHADGPNESDRNEQQ